MDLKTIEIGVHHAIIQSEIRPVTRKEAKKGEVVPHVYNPLRVTIYYQERTRDSINTRKIELSPDQIEKIHQIILNKKNEGAFDAPYDPGLPF